MTTDITELAQSLKAAAEKAGIEQWVNNRGEVNTADYEVDGGVYIDHICNCEIVGTESPRAEFIALANPANILALVEALEKAQHEARVDWEAAASLNVENQELKRRIAELESRTVKLPPELYTIGELIRTQDNRITDQPMFVVFQKREIIGSDEHSPSRICWVWDGEEVSELRAKRLEALYQNGRDIRGYDRYAMQEVDEFVTACFTEHGCKDFLRQNGHNLRQPYIYACGSFRNNEYQLVRNWLAGIKWEAE